MDWIVQNADKVLDLVIAVAALLATIPAVSRLKAGAVAKVQEMHMATAWRFAITAVTEVYAEYVRTLKESGKFDEAAKTHAAARAKDKLWEMIKGEGLQVAQDCIPGLIEMAVTYLKTKGVLAKASPFGGAASPVLGSASVAVPGLPQPEL